MYWNVFQKFCLFFLEKQCLQMDTVLYLYGRESGVKEGCLSLEQKVSECLISQAIYFYRLGPTFRSNISFNSFVRRVPVMQENNTY